jgi:L-alanine-DL-glutamate epimerase-like enolase superfamily enzyme
VTDFPLYESMVAHSLEVDDDGYVAVPDEPGLGGLLPERILTEYGV